MSKIYIEVYTPGNGKQYEFVLDDKSSIGQVKQKIIDEISLFENGQLSLDKNSILFNSSKQQQLSDSCLVRNASVDSGNTLILL